MGSAFDINAKAKTVTILAPQVGTATTTGTGIDCTRFDGIAKATQSVGAMSGAGQTIDTVVQHSATVGGTYVTIATFPQVVVASGANTTADIPVDLRGLNGFIRAVATIGGTITTNGICVTLACPGVVNPTV